MPVTCVPAASACGYGSPESSRSAAEITSGAASPGDDVAREGGARVCEECVAQQNQLLRKRRKASWRIEKRLDCSGKVEDGRAADERNPAERAGPALGLSRVYEKLGRLRRQRRSLVPIYPGDTPR